ncbi:coenzyme Q-binding protein COQ10 homolog B, mitochondrial-like [Elgaria multicarinata webbii]|uniref:coenzyme Q-binding protein COQ10 homolog B, mitochondrial-like n=1 Tax=Elgaria multicarinata webbii TaxID=159646 RepID=UPI002FCD63DD
MAATSRLGRSVALAVRGLLESGLRPRCAKGARFEKAHAKKRLGLPHCRQLSSVLSTCPFLASRSAVIQQQTRSFLNLATSLLGAKRVEYAEVRQLPYSVDQMYDIVADVGSYQLFVPWCTCSRVISHRNEFSQAELEVGFPPVVERYLSEIISEPHHQIRAVSKDGQLFQHLETLWQFQPGRVGKLDTCTLKFYVSFEFKSVLHTQLANLFFNEVVKQMVSAFEQRAEKLYGSQTAAHPRKAVHCT